MAQTKAQLVVGLNVNASAPASALQIDASGNVNLDSNTLYVDATNNRVGIGTSSPGSLLTVKSPGAATTFFNCENSSGTSILRLFQTAGGSGRLIVSDSTGTDFFNVQADQGRVGIGISSPTTTLDVAGNARLHNSTSNTNRKLEMRSTQGYSSFIQFTEDNIADRWSLGIANGDGGFIFKTGADFTGTERLRITSAGNVGIGTASPGSLNSTGNQLVVGSGTGNQGLTIFAGSSSDSNIYFADGTAGTAPNIGYIQYRHASDRFDFGTVDTTRMSLDSAGRLLVGTSTSVYSSSLLTVRGGISTSVGDFNLASTVANITSGNDIGAIRITNTNGYRGAQITAEATGNWTEGTSQPTALVFSTTASGASNPTERMRIGNIGGIDVSATGNGDNHLRNTAAQTTASGANLFIDATSGVLRRSTSSIKYKTNVETLQDSYADEILKCRPVWYQSTSSYDNQQWGYWGFIAEEVAAIDPRLCLFGTNENGSLEPEGVQYDRFVPHLLNLIKRQQQAIEDLQAEVAALKAQ